MNTTEFVPPRLPEVGYDPDDLRVGSVIGTALGGGGWELVLIGFPSDEGVRRNHGRPGAAEAPDEIRRNFYRSTLPAGNSRFRELLRRTRDFGNLRMSGNLESDQDRLGKVVGGLLSEGILVAILGGGHETAFGHFLGYVAAGRPVHIVNWDAHPDVRPLRNGVGHSGSPFRQALEHPSGSCLSYSVLGIQERSSVESHLEFVRDRGGKVVPIDGLGPDAGQRILDQLEGPVMVSFDLDVVDQAYAPGVSAPATGGMSSREWLQAARAAGRCAAVTSVDFVEVCPTLDRDRQTSRLAAAGLWNFLCGVSLRDSRVRESRQT